MLSLTSSVFTIMRQSAEVAILPRYRSLEAHEVSAKAGGDTVTIADHASEAILTEGLARLLPEAVIVAEEAVYFDPSLARELGNSLCWVIDPLDGTNNFAAGNPPFGIIVALAEAGETIAGWIFDPLTGRCCHAERGKGAFVDGAKLISRGSGEAKPIVAISMARVDPRHTGRMRDLLEPRSSIVNIPRCAAEQYPRIAMGQNDLAFFNRTFAWDHAAGVLFLNEAGGKAARYDGSPYRLDDEKVGLLVAATPALWDWLTELLKDT
ncbi:inositol monophosphatase [Novosphingobium sp. G106]|uniref:inositol monophosphatase family protein n=1 Tax=Novosphingobium sp. G106 TaxID=2849500 RepID=UPI001C2DAB72|nr:inositol monophosphatase family protein [Novosphingobium sp. G106]MBV1690427.1 inositol monophosphatase [Novosphingobium sp. G106]